VNHELSQGHVPWAQIFLGNEASIALQRRLGLTLTPADEQCFIAG
jgi:RimJ/RimL family protein N-acetyltransferase